MAIGDLTPEPWTENKPVRLVTTDTGGGSDHVFILSTFMMRFGNLAEKAAGNYNTRN